MNGPIKKKSLDIVSPKAAEVIQPTEPADEPVEVVAPVEETSMADTALPVAEVATVEATTEAKPKDPKAKPTWWKRKAVWIPSVVVLVLLIGGGAWWYTHRAPAKVAAAMPTPKPSPTPVPTPITKADPLTGAQVDPATASQPVIGVMIENLDPDARPQSGLGSAGLVYEALAEGGITRFLAVFQEPLPTTIGPVRSLRPYFLDWGLEHGIPVVHAGGSQPALAEVKPLGLKDINALAYDGSYFYRATDRLAPHNLYTTATKLSALDTQLGFATAPTFTPFPRKVDAPEATPAHPTIDITFSYADYNVEYKYDAPTNSYARFMAGTAHIDRNTGKQIFVKNVVVQFVSTTYSTQNDGDPETDMQLVGTGKALFFMDGGATVGTWTKSSNAAQTTYADANGAPIAFNVGNTWIETVPTINTVGY